MDTENTRVYKGKIPTSLKSLVPQIPKEAVLLTPQHELDACRQIRNYHKKHLKAYLRGQYTYTHGKDKDGKPIVYTVLQSITKRS